MKASHYMTNGRLYFLGAIYNTTGAFSHLMRFVNRFGGDLNNLPFDRDAVLNFTSNTIATLSEAKGKVDNQTALNLLIADDLRKVEAVLADDNFKAKIEGEMPIEEALISCRDQGVTLLKNLGLPVSPP